MSGIVIQYTASIFIEPKPLTETKYSQIKDLLKDDQYTSIFTQENTDGMYDSYYWTMSIAAGR